jgi:pimeloyl-ACP methyl ester carboxylesterase
VRLEGCGHFVMLDRPAALARLSVQFSDEAAAAPLAFTSAVR